MKCMSFGNKNNEEVRINFRNVTAMTLVDSV